MQLFPSCTSLNYLLSGIDALNVCVKKTATSSYFVAYYISMHLKLLNQSCYKMCIWWATTAHRLSGWRHSENIRYEHQKKRKKKKKKCLITYVGYMIPLVLKKHSPLLYTEKHGTVALRKDSRARSILAVFAISENRRSAKVKETPWTHQSDSGSSTQYSGWCSHLGWSFQHCV